MKSIGIFLIFTLFLICFQTVAASDCACTFQLDPVCGSDVKDYGTKCALECAATKSPGLTVLHEGKCGGCACPKILNPVCGSDGKTYNTPCELSCDAKKNETLKLTKKSDGECKKA